MSKARWQVASRKRRKKLLGQAKGYRNKRRVAVRKVKETVMRAEAYATRDRKARTREFRSLWIIRLNAAARARGLTYRTLVHALKQANITLNRKQLSELAIQDPGVFDELVKAAVGKTLKVAAVAA